MTKRGIRQNGLKYSEKKLSRKRDKETLSFGPKHQRKRCIYSYVEGEFNGWQGDEVFKLGNGQVWKQMDNGTTFYIPKKNQCRSCHKPKTGAWYLYVAGYNKGVRVKE